MYKYIVQLIVAIPIFMITLFFSWYEGSAIIEKSTQWIYSTPFTNFLNIEILSGKDIIWLDYFVYAIKFQPVFPLISFICTVYIFVNVILIILKFNKRIANILLGTSCIVVLFLCGILFGASTKGGQLFFLISIICEVMLLIFFVYQIRKKDLEGFVKN